MKIKVDSVSKADISLMTDPSNNRQMPAAALPPRHQLPAHNPTPSPAKHVEPTKIDVLAILSFVFNFVGLSLVSIILGHIALKRTHKGKGDGYGLALAGTIIGYVAASFIFLGVAAAVILPIFLNQQKAVIYESIQTDVKATVSEVQSGAIPLDAAEKTLDTDNGNNIYIQTNGSDYIVYGTNEAIETYVFWYDSTTGEYETEDTTTTPYGDEQ